MALFNDGEGDDGEGEGEEGTDDDEEGEPAVPPHPDPSRPWEPSGETRRDERARR